MQRAGFIVVIAFLLSFLFIRTSARLIRNPKITWWPGNVETAGGLHLHHLVFGIVMMTVAGFLSFAIRHTSPATEILAALFGVGAGLTFDEFALWVHLKDVYWTEEGRSSINAVVVVAALAGLIVLGAGPFDLHQSGATLATLTVTIILDLLLSTIAILKGKPFLGVIGVFMPLFSLVGSIRLATPTSYWAKRRYRPGSRKLAKAEERWQRVKARRRRWSDRIAGAPGLPHAAEPTEQAEPDAVR